MNRSKTLDLLLVQLCYFPGVNCYNFNYSCTKNDIDAKLESNVEREKKCESFGRGTGSIYILYANNPIFIYFFTLHLHYFMPERFWYSRLLPATLVTLAFKLQSLTIGRGCHGDAFQFERKQKVRNCFFRGLSLLQNVFLRLTRPPPPYLTLISVVFNSVLLQSDLLAVWLVRTMVLQNRIAVKMILFLTWLGNSMQRVAYGINRILPITLN